MGSTMNFMESQAIPGLHHGPLMKLHDCLIVIHTLKFPVEICIFHWDPMGIFHKNHLLQVHQCETLYKTTKSFSNISLGNQYQDCVQESGKWLKGIDMIRVSRKIEMIFQCAICLRTVWLLLWAPLSVIIDLDMMLLLVRWLELFQHYPLLEYTWTIQVHQVGRSAMSCVQGKSRVKWLCSKGII